MKYRLNYPELYNLKYRNIIKLPQTIINKFGQLKFIKEKISDQSLFNYVSELFRMQSIKNREQSYLLGKHFGFRYINPFYDLKILEFVSSVPKEIIFCDGLGRGLLRKSGLLPHSVEHRLNKTVFKYYHLEVLKLLYPVAIKKFGNNHKLWEFIDKENFLLLGNKLMNFEIKHNQPIQNYNNEDVMGLSRIIYLGIWLGTFFKE